MSGTEFNESQPAPEFAPGGSTGSSEVRRRHLPGDQRPPSIGREPSLKEARTLFDQRNAEMVDDSTAAKKARTVSEKFGPNEKAIANEDDGPLDIFLDKVLKMDSQNLLRIMYLSFSVIAAIVMGITYLVMRKLGCHPHFVGSEEFTYFRTEPNIIFYNPYEAHEGAIDRCVSTRIENRTVSMSALSHIGEQNSLIMNVTLVDQSTIDVYKFEYSLISNVTFKAPVSYKKFEMKDCVMQKWREEEQGIAEQSNIDKSLLLQMTFLESKSFSLATIKESVVGVIQFLGSVVLDKVKVHESLIREVLAYSSAKYNDIKVVKTLLKTLLWKSDVRIDKLISVTSNYLGVRIDGAFSAHDAKLFKNTVEDVVVGEQVLLKGFHAERSSINGFYVGEEFAGERVSIQQVKIGKVAVESSFTVDTVTMGNSTFSNAHMQKAAMISSLTAAETAFEKLFFFSTTSINKLKFKDSRVSNKSEIEEVYFGERLMMEKSNMANSSITTVLVKGDASFAGSSFNNVQFTNVTFLGDVNLTGTKMKKVTFKGCTFLGDTDFSRTTAKTVNIDDCYFNGDVILDETDLVIDPSEMKSKRQVRMSLKALASASETLPAFPEAPGDLHFPDEVEEEEEITEGLEVEFYDYDYEDDDYGIYDEDEEEIDEL